MGHFEAIGREFVRRGWLADTITPEVFAECRAYVAGLPGAVPYDLLCPTIVRADTSQAAAVEAEIVDGEEDEAVPVPVILTPSPLECSEDLPAAYGFYRFGPILSAFAHWVWQLPFVQGQAIVGVMRDGGVLASALQAVRPGSPVGEVWLGRRLCLAGAIHSAEDREGLVNLLVRARGQPASVAEALEGLGLVGETLPRGLNPTQILQPDSLPKFLDWVTEAGAKKALETHCRSIRLSILNHLREQRALDGGQLLMVDVGYAGSIQRALASILQIEGINVRLAGAYLLTTPGILWMLRSGGGDAAGFLAHLGAPSWLAKPFVRSREVFESLCASPFGPLVGYGPDSKPILGEVILPDWQTKEISRLQQQALAFCGSGQPPLSRSEAQRAAMSLIANPRPEEASMIGRWVYDDPLAVGTPRGLIKYRDGAERSVLWPQGAMAASQGMGERNDS
ncbi:MAG: hypothetical protein H7X89_00040 [Rhizobiales bacterium]|nr:hypothetical protein [Hyphomicrobiales bacterium]